MDTFSYDEVNRQIVEAPDRLIMVTGSAGTGKTRTAIRRAEWIASNFGPETNQRILFLSFSRASRVRMRQALRLHAPGILPVCDVVTFDSMCLSLAARYREWLGLSGALRVSQRKDDGPSYHHEPAEDGHYATFGEIRALALRVLGREDVARAIADAYPHILVDEFQDTGQEHYDLLMCLWPRSAVCAFGDPYQDILPGAKTFDAIGSLLDHDATHWKLSCQRRQPEWLRLFAEAIKADNCQLITRSPEHKSYANVQHQLRVVIHWDIREARRAGQDVAVITFRTERALEVARALGEDKTTKQGKFYHRWPVRVDCADDTLNKHLVTVELVWQVLLDCEAAICERAHQSLCEAVNSRRAETRQKVARSRCPATRIAELTAEMASRITGCATSDFLLAANVVAKLHSELADKRAPECALLETATRQLQAHIRDDVEVTSPADVRRVMRRARVARLAAHDLEKDGQGNAVRVMNVHQAKNREFDFVALIYDMRDVHGGSQSDQASEEHRMLLYQAVTRAKQQLVIYYWAGAKGTRTPLGPCLSRALTT